MRRREVMELLRKLYEAREMCTNSVAKLNETIAQLEKLLEELP